LRDLTALEIATRVAWSFHGLPYRWGGDDPMAGFDCSGYIVEILKSVAILPRIGDWTAQDIYDLYVGQKFPIAEEGMLVFWRNNRRIIHVEYCLNEDLSIGASGGGGRTITEEEAIEQNAYIKVRSFWSRKNPIGFFDPFLL